MKQLLAWTGSADCKITSEAVMAMAEKFDTVPEVCLQITKRAWSYASHRGHLSHSHHQTTRLRFPSAKT
jgi:hypothetical protein